MTDLLLFGHMVIVTVTTFAAVATFAVSIRSTETVRVVVISLFETVIVPVPDGKSVGKASVVVSLSGESVILTVTKR